MHASLGSHRLQAGADPRRLGLQRLGPAIDGFARNHPELHHEPAVGSGDVVRGTARDHARMQRGVVGAKRGGQGRDRFGRVCLVLPVHPADQPRRLHDRRHAFGQQRGMHLEALHVHAVAGAALVPGDDPHPRRLADQCHPGLGNHALHRGDHRRGTGAAHLLVIGNRDLQRPLHALRLRLDQRPQGQRKIPLHVAGAAPIQPAVALGHHPRVAGPRLPVDRHHVGMPRQHHAILDPWPDMGKMCCLLPVFVPVPVRGDAMACQIAFDPVDQLQIAVAADGWKADQPV